jgi:uncharacterized protein YycO
MANSGNSLKNDDIREVASVALTAAYQVFGGVFLRDAYRLWITNNTNGDIYLSTDGVKDMMKLPAGSGRAYDDKTNDSYRKKTTQFYIRFSVVPAIPSGWAALEVEYV